MNKKAHLFNDILFFHAQNGESHWTTVFSIKDTSTEREYINCVFADEEDIENQFLEVGWNDFLYDFRPKNVPKDNGDFKYYRYGSEHRIIPLVIQRYYFDIFPSEIEISEEFRLFFNIYIGKQKNGIYNCLDENGEEDTIIEITENLVKVKTRYLQEFAASKKIQFLIIFEYVRFFEESLNELGELSDNQYTGTDEKLNYHIDFQNRLINDYKSNSRLIGKKRLTQLQNYHPKSIYDNFDKKTYENFIVKLDSDGQEIHKSCNISYRSSDDNAHFLSLIFFKREVLRKYYDNPSHYDVENSYIRKKGGWYLRVDNNNKAYVVVFLGDLGQILPSKEQVHWRSYNIPPEGYLSSAYYKSQIEGEFASPELSEFNFKYLLESLNSVFLMRFSFALFKDLPLGDEFHLKTLRIPLINSQNEFDQQIMSLIKIIIDSINEDEICKSIHSLCIDTANNFKLEGKTLRGIDKLKLFLETHGYKETPQLIEYLRSIQSIRSTGVAHLKGSNYKKQSAKFGIGEKSFIDIFDEILINLNIYLNDLLVTFKPNIGFVGGK